jgi:hypothetical protein
MNSNFSNQPQAASARQNVSQQNINPQQNASQKTSDSDFNASQQQDSWMSHPALKNIDPARLQLLSSLASEAQGKNKNELLPFLMAAASQTGSGQLSFGSDEIDTIIQVLKIGKSQEEIQQIDRLCTLFRQFRQTNR